MKASDVEDEEYNNLLRGRPSDSMYEALVAGGGVIGDLVKQQRIGKEAYLEMVRAATMCTVCPSTILPDGMERSRCEIETIAVEKEFGVHDGCQLPERGTVEFEEWAILQCMFKHAQNIAQFWFQHNQQNEQFWDKNFPADFPFDREAVAPPSTASPVLYPFRSKVANPEACSDRIEWSNTELERVFGGDVQRIKALQQELQSVQAQSADNEHRVILKERAVHKLSAQISEMEETLSRRVKASVYNTRSHLAGYTVDVDASIAVNLEKCMAL